MTTKRLGELFSPKREQEDESLVRSGIKEWAPQILGDEKCLCGHEMAWKGFMLGPACYPRPAKRTQKSIQSIPRNWAQGPRYNKRGLIGDYRGPNRR